jgi:hypothetical protein
VLDAINEFPSPNVISSPTVQGIDATDSHTGDSKPRSMYGPKFIEYCKLLFEFIYLPETYNTVPEVVVVVGAAVVVVVGGAAVVVVVGAAVVVVVGAAVVVVVVGAAVVVVVVGAAVVVVVVVVVVVDVVVVVAG